MKLKDHQLAINLANSFVSNVAAMVFCAEVKKVFDELDEPLTLEMTIAFISGYCAMNEVTKYTLLALENKLLQKLSSTDQ